MIHAKELRIGNIIYIRNLENAEHIQGESFSLNVGREGTITTDNNLFKVNEILATHVMGSLIGKDKYMGNVFSNIWPIPLTPEILEKCGFRFDDQGRFFYNGLRVSSSFVRREPVEGWIQLDAPIGTTMIKSLHHLQNWFHAISGQELTIKL